MVSINQFIIPLKIEEYTNFQIIYLLICLFVKNIFKYYLIININ